MLVCSGGPDFWLRVYLFSWGVVSGAMAGERPYIPVRVERLSADVRTLTDIKPPRNYRNLSSLGQATDYIGTEFRKINCEITIQTFVVRSREYRNVICSFSAKNTERIVIGAHYDVAGNTPGADDNGSGVAGLLELGRLINELNPELKYRIDLVAYSLEEPPFFRTQEMGSYVHAKSLAEAGVRVRAMLCLESIGYFSDEPGSQGFPAFFFQWFFPDKGNFIVVVGKWGQGELVKDVRMHMAAGSTIPVDYIIAPTFVPGIDLSDHINYWRFSYPAAMITDSAFYRNPHYHEPTDTLQTIDFTRMAEVVKGIYWVVLHL